MASDPKRQIPRLDHIEERLALARLRWRAAIKIGFAAARQARPWIAGWQRAQEKECKRLALVERETVLSGLHVVARTFGDEVTR